MSDVDDIIKELGLIRNEINNIQYDLIIYKRNSAMIEEDVNKFKKMMTTKLIKKLMGSSYPDDKKYNAGKFKRSKSTFF